MSTPQQIKTCSQLRPQNCIYSAQGELICNKLSNEVPKQYRKDIDLSFGVPFYEGNNSPVLDFFNQDIKENFIRSYSTQ
jgi:hypothetical protein